MLVIFQIQLAVNSPSANTESSFVGIFSRAHKARPQERPQQKANTTCKPQQQRQYRAQNHAIANVAHIKQLNTRNSRSKNLSFVVIPSCTTPTTAHEAETAAREYQQSAVTSWPCQQPRVPNGVGVGVTLIAHRLWCCLCSGRRGSVFVCPRKHDCNQPSAGTTSKQTD